MRSSSRDQKMDWEENRALSLLGNPMAGDVVIKRSV